jgi:hypothetical protein
MKLKIFQSFIIKNIFHQIKKEKIFPNIWVVLHIETRTANYGTGTEKNRFKFEINFQKFQVFELFSILELKPKVMQLIPRIDPVSNSVQELRLESPLESSGLDVILSLAKKRNLKQNRVLIH